MSDKSKSEKKNRINCRGCKARYDTSGMAPGSPFSCRHCGEVLYVPGERSPEQQDKAEIPFGQAAVEMGFITTAQLASALKDQRHAENRSMRLGDVLVDKGYLNNRQVTVILHAQGARQAFLIPGYEIVQKLGEGGMGAVFKGVHLSSKKTVAMKILSDKLASRPEFLERFHREARVAIDLDHPHIVKGYDEGAIGKTHYFVMEYVHGKSVGRVLKKRGHFGERRSMDIIRQIVSALDCAYKKNIVHRDIKPDNIMITRDGQAKLADYGLVKFTDNLDEAGLTSEGQIMGTPNYISPEQASGKGVIDIRCDIYSLGATLYHMLTGKPPYKGNSVGVVMGMHVSSPVPNPQEISPETTDRARDTVMKMMTKDISGRYQTPAELMQDINAYFAEEPDDAKTLQAVGFMTPTPAYTNTEIMGQAGPSESRLMQTVGDDHRELKKTAPLLLIIGLAIVIVGLGVAIAVAWSMAEEKQEFRPGTGRDVYNSHESAVNDVSSGKATVEVTPAHSTNKLSPEDKAAATLYNEALLLAGEEKIAKYREILKKYPRTNMAKKVRPEIAAVDRKLQDERRKVERERKEKREAEGMRAINDAMYLTKGGYDEKIRALQQVAERFKGLDAEKFARKNIRQLREHKALEQKRKEDAKRQEQEAKRAEQKAKRLREEGFASAKFHTAWPRAIRDWDFDKADQLCGEIIDDKGLPGIKWMAENCRTDTAAAKMFLPAVVAGLEAPGTKAEQELVLASGMKYKGRVVLVKDDKFTILINGKVPATLNILKLSDGQLEKLFRKGYGKRDPHPQIVIGMFYFICGKEKEALSAFRAAGDAKPPFSHHRNMLKWE